MFKNILLPLDGSENAEKIAAWSEGLALSFGSNLTLLTVVDPEKVARSDFGPQRDRAARGASETDKPAGSTELSAGLAVSGPIAVASESAHNIQQQAFGTQVIERAVEDSKKEVVPVVCTVFPFL